MRTKLTIRKDFVGFRDFLELLLSLFFLLWILVWMPFEGQFTISLLDVNSSRCSTYLQDNVIVSHVVRMDVFPKCCLSRQRRMNWDWSREMNEDQSQRQWLQEKGLCCTRRILFSLRFRSRNPDLEEVSKVSLEMILLLWLTLDSSRHETNGKNTCRRTGISLSRLLLKHRQHKENVRWEDPDEALPQMFPGFADTSQALGSRCRETNRASNSRRRPSCLFLCFLFLFLFLFLFPTPFAGDFICAASGLSFSLSFEFVRLFNIPSEVTDGSLSRSQLWNWKE